MHSNEKKLLSFQHKLPSKHEHIMLKQSQRKSLKVSFVRSDPAGDATHNGCGIFTQTYLISMTTLLFQKKKNT